MYKTEPPVLPLPRALRAATALVLAAGAAVAAQAQAPSAPPVTAAAPAPAAQPMAAAGAENAEQLGQTATLIARLRQQQAVVEAQAALAKANAELARIQQSTQPATVAASDPSVALAASLIGMPRRDMRLLGVSGSPQQRVATLEMPDGGVRDVRAGTVIGTWVVHEVRLAEVVLRPRGRGNVQRTLLDDGSMRELPYVQPVPARAVRSKQP